jgi:hypothetical protein
MSKRTHRQRNAADECAETRSMLLSRITESTREIVRLAMDVAILDRFPDDPVPPEVIEASLHGALFDRKEEAFYLATSYLVKRDSSQATEAVYVEQKVGGCVPTDGPYFAMLEPGTIVAACRDLDLINLVECLSLPEDGWGPFSIPHGSLQP